MSGMDVLLQTAMSIKKLNILKQKQCEYLNNRERNDRHYKGILKKNVVFKSYGTPLHSIFENNCYKSHNTISEVDKKFTNVKNVTVVTPAFGTENAIVTIPKEVSLPAQKPSKFQDKAILTKIIEDIKHKETATKIDKTDIVTQTNNILKVSEEQFDDIQKLIQEMRDLKEKQKEMQEKQNKRLERLTNTRNRSLSKRSYAKKKELHSALTNLNKTLKKLHEKYLAKPKITYKSVKECCTQYKSNNLNNYTQSSCLDLIYENTRFPMVATDNMDTPKESNTDVCERTETVSFATTDFKISAEPNYEYDDRKSLNEASSELKILEKAEKNVENKLAHLESSKMQKFMSVRQQICDVDRVCDQFEYMLNNSNEIFDIIDDNKITNSTTQTDNAEQDRDLRKTDEIKYRKTKFAFTQPNMACGDDSKVEKCIKNSRYLMREMSQYQTRSKVKMLSDNGLITREILRISDDESLDKQEESINQLMENLSLVMKSSLYRPEYL